MPKMKVWLSARDNMQGGRPVACVTVEGEAAWLPMSRDDAPKMRTFVASEILEVHLADEVGNVTTLERNVAGGLTAGGRFAGRPDRAVVPCMVCAKPDECRINGCSEERNLPKEDGVADLNPASLSKESRRVLDEAPARLELDALLKEAVARHDAMTPVERAAHDHEQRRSWVRGMCPSNRDYEEWCRRVDEVLPPAPLRRQFDDEGRRAWVERWRRKHVMPVHSNPRGHALKLFEEVVELCFAAGASTVDMMKVLAEEGIKNRNKKQDPATAKDDLGEECADVAICLDVLLLECGVDLPAEVAKKVPVLEGRQWAPDQDGVLRRPR